MTAQMGTVAVERTGAVTVINDPRENAERRERAAAQPS